MQNMCMCFVCALVTYLISELYCSSENVKVIYGVLNVLWNQLTINLRQVN